MTSVSRNTQMFFLFALVSLFVSAEHTSQANQLPAAPNNTFSIVVIPDTQYYFGRGTKREPDSSDPVTNPTFDAWTDWIAANVKRQRIVFVSHVGDIVDRNTVEQWKVARRCMDRLHGTLPYGIAVGNHDMTSAGDSSLFQRFFPQSRFATFDWYGGCFENGADDSAISGNNANSVQLFEAGGMRFVALHIECNAPNNVLAWVDSVLEQHADRRAMITTHMGLGPLHKPQNPQDYFDAPKGRMQWKKCHGKRGNTPQQMWDKCFRKHRNLFLILYGDQSRTQALRQTSTGDGDNRVHELLSDYGANGLRILRFIPARNVIEVRTWDPVKRRLCETTDIVPDREQHQFVLDYEMSQERRESTRSK